MTAELTEVDAEHRRRMVLLDRVRQAVEGGKPRQAALHDAVQAAGVNIRWHEAEVVAEALRHRYDGIHSQSQWVRVGMWRDPDALRAIRRDMRLALLVAVDEGVSALVEEPVEWLYAAPETELRHLIAPPADDERGRTPLAAAQVAALPDHFYVLIRLVGHTQRLDR